MFISKAGLWKIFRLEPFRQAKKFADPCFGSRKNRPIHNQQNSIWHHNLICVADNHNQILQQRIPFFLILTSRELNVKYFSKLFQKIKQNYDYIMLVDESEI